MRPVLFWLPAAGLRAASLAVACTGIALLLAACGSSGSSSSEASSRAGTGNGVASESPAQIVGAAQAALRSARSFVAAGYLTQGGQPVHLRIVDGGPTTALLQVEGGGESAEIIVLGTAGYVRANQAFWSSHAGARAAGLANRWIELPANAGSRLTSGFGAFAPSTLARCLGENLGTLRRAGTTTVDGQPAVAVHDAGNVPGGTPGTLAVASRGPAYPLRLTSMGRTRPGGRIDVCNDGRGDGGGGRLTFSDFDQAPAITAPKHPIKAGQSSGPTV